MNDDVDRQLVERIAQVGRAIVPERLSAAVTHQAAARAPSLALDPAQLERLVQSSVQRAGGAVWRRSLAEAAVRELGIGLSEAVDHPAVIAAHALAGAPPYVRAATATPDAETAPAPAPEQPAVDDSGEQPSSPRRAREPRSRQPAPRTPRGTQPTPDPASSQATRLAAIHVTGIETLRPGDRDIELRLSQAGLDVLKRSSGIAIGRLDWAEIETIEMLPPRRGLRSRRRARELVVSTGRGQARFELAGLTEEDLREHVEPLLAQLHQGATSAGRR